MDILKDVFIFTDGSWKSGVGGFAAVAFVPSSGQVIDIATGSALCNSVHSMEVTAFVKGLEVAKRLITTHSDAVVHIVYDCRSLGKCVRKAAKPDSHLSTDLSYNLVQSIIDVASEFEDIVCSADGMPVSAEQGRIHFTWVSSHADEIESVLYAFKSSDYKEMYHAQKRVCVHRLKSDFSLQWGNALADVEANRQRRHLSNQHQCRLW